MPSEGAGEDNPNAQIARQPARNAPTLTIPVHITGARVDFLFGKKMPSIAPGARADLVVSTPSVLDKYIARLLGAEQVSDLLPAGACVLIAIRPSPGDTSASNAAHGNRVPLMKAGLLYFETILEQPLALRLSGARLASFVGGACVIPALENRRAISLNQACTLLSERFQAGRASHVGNAFKTGIFFDEAAGQWQALEAARAAVQARFEEYLCEQAAVTDRRRRLLEPPTFAEWAVSKQAQPPLPF